MLSRRRLTLQLTPLLDLLLIVMFIQYIENRNRSVAAEENFSAQKVELETLRSQLQQEAEQRQAALEQKFAKQRQTVDELRQVYDARFRSIIDQHHQIGSLLAEALNLPGATMTEILKLRTSSSPEDAQRLTEATEHLRELMKSRGDEIFRFLIKVDEMQKHVSIWEVHVQDNGQALISDGQQSSVSEFGSEADFSVRLFEASKSFADPKTQVIILLTWGDAQGGVRRKAIDGMPLLTEQLRRDSAGIRWYDFSIVGFRVEGPILSQTKRLPP
jgi:uncharacterized coiled-coil protein SlyX